MGMQITKQEVETALEPLKTLPQPLTKLILTLVSQDRLELGKIIKTYKTPYGTLDLKKVIKEGTYMGLLAQQMGPAVLVKMLILLVTDFCKQYNVVRNMSTDQITDYCIEQVEEYPHYKFEDYVLFFDAAKKGNYGVPFDHIDKAVIDTWFEKYHQQRVAAKDDIHQEYKNLGRGPGMSQAMETSPLDEKFVSFGGALSDLKVLVQENRDKLKQSQQTDPPA